MQSKFLQVDENLKNKNLVIYITLQYNDLKKAIMSIENTKLNKINQQAIFFTKTTDKLHIDKEMCQF